MYKYLFNNQSLKNRRRELRKNQTEAEEKLWEYLRDRRLGGFKFIRQYSVGPYILDFYCPKTRLGVEIDGRAHAKNETATYDKDRETGLKEFNINLIRFWNDEVLNDTSIVLEKTIKALNQEGPAPFS